MNLLCEKGNIEFTAYYTPIFTVQHSEDEIYRYPIVKIESAKDTITNKRITTTIWAKNEKEVGKYGQKCPT